MKFHFSWDGFVFVERNASFECDECGVTDMLMHLALLAALSRLYDYYTWNSLLVIITRRTYAGEERSAK